MSPQTSWALCRALSVPACERLPGDLDLAAQFLDDRANALATLANNAWPAFSVFLPNSAGWLRGIAPIGPCRSLNSSFEDVHGTLKPHGGKPSPKQLLLGSVFTYVYYSLHVFFIRLSGLHHQK